MDESIKFVWAYMIENGVHTNGKWNYYSSGYGAANHAQSFSYEKTQAAYKQIQDNVKKYGVNWELTKAPKSSQENCFDGTFVESSSAETLLGDLHLNDGSVYTIGVNNADVRFSGYLENLRQLLEDKQRVSDILGE